MRKPANPFIVSGYSGPAYFCDRKEEVNWLNEQFSNERNAILYSWRRMGKTVLIRHFFYHLEKEKKAETVYVDLLGTTSMAEANMRIASALFHRFGGIQRGMGTKLMKLLGSVGASLEIDPLSGNPRVTFGLVKSSSVQASLEASGRFLSERKKPVVICIDEFQQIVNYTEKNAEAVFRTWTQALPLIRFIFSGSQRHIMISMFSEKSRPFYRSAQMKKMDPLPETEYAAFISSFFKEGRQAGGCRQH